MFKAKDSHTQKQPEEQLTCEKFSPTQTLLRTPGSQSQVTWFFKY